MKRKINLINLQGLGNTINAIPVICALQKKHDLQVTCFKDGSHVLLKQLDFDIELKSYSNTLESFTDEAQSCDFAVAAYPNWKREFFTLMNTNAKTKYTFATNDLYNQLNTFRKIDFDPDAHDVENNLNMLEYFGIDPEGYSEFVGPQFAGERNESDEKIAVLHPTASTPTKYYPHRLWKDIIQYLKASGYTRIIAICSNNDHEVNFSRELINFGPVELRIQSSFDELVGLFKKSQLFIGLDSSMAHLAALTDCPIICLWSFADYNRIFPYGNNVKVIIPQETIPDIQSRYPKKKLDFLDRLNFDFFKDVVEGQLESCFQRQPKFKDTVYFYSY